MNRAASATYSWQKRPFNNDRPLSEFVHVQEAKVPFFDVIVKFGLRFLEVAEFEEDELQDIAESFSAFICLNG